MRQLWFVAVLLLCALEAAPQQSVIGDVLSGSLVKPKEGQWAWYDVKDANTGLHYALRQAIVGSEKVGKKTGYWVELEIVPIIGYKTVYKMLLTGPASDPKHLHRVMTREGAAPPKEMPLATETEKSDKKEQDAAKEERLGFEDIKTETGTVSAEHLRVTSAGGVSDMWINDEVRPMGIVRLSSAQGELVLRSYGEGGEDARSIIDDDKAMAEGRAAPEPKVEVRVNGETVPANESPAPGPGDPAPSKSDAATDAKSDAAENAGKGKP